MACERRRDRRDGPEHRRDPLDGLGADVQAEHLRRAHRPEEARAAAQPDGRQGEELPRPEPRDRGPLSARLDLQAGDRARGDAGAPDLAVPDDPVHAGLRGARPGLQELGPVRERADDDADRRSAPRATRTSTTSATRSTRCRPTAATRSRAGRAASGSGSRPGSTSAPSRTDCCRRPSGGDSTYTKKTDPCCWQVDRLWKPGDSIQLAIGQKDLLVTPLQMTRFFSLIANGGKLVQPRIVRAVQQPDSNGWHYLNPPLPTPSGVDPAALAVVRDGLWRATHASYGTATSVFGELPDHRRRQDGHSGEVRAAARLQVRGAPGPVLVVRLRARPRSRRSRSAR